jgi:hypothetical protein
MRRLLGLSLTACTIGFAPAASPAPADALVEKLGDGAYREREAAGRALLKLGPAALAALDRAAADPDAEVRARASALAAQIRKADENAKRLVPPTLTLDYTGVPLGTVVADLKAKTGIPLTLDPAGVADPVRNVTLKTGPVTPWEAVDALCRAAGLKEVFRADLSAARRPQNPFVNGRRQSVEFLTTDGLPVPAHGVAVLLADGKPDALPGTRSTPVRVLALPPTFPGNRVVRGSGEVVLNLDVTPTPAAQWTDLIGVRVHRATDEAGRPVSVAFNSDDPYAVDESGNPLELLAEDAGGVRVNPRVVPLRLRTGDRLVSKLKVLEGVVVGDTVVPNQALATIDNLPKNVGLTAHAPGDARITVVSYEARADGRVSVRVRTENPNVMNGFLNGRRMWQAAGRNAFGQLRFYDAAGNLLRQPSVAESNLNDDGITQSNEYHLIFPKPTDHGRPVKLVLVGNKPTTLEVPFRMENVRLP